MDAGIMEDGSILVLDDQLRELRRFVAIQAAVASLPFPTVSVLRRPRVPGLR